MTAALGVEGATDISNVGGDYIVRLFGGPPGRLFEPTPPPIRPPGWSAGAGPDAVRRGPSDARPPPW